MDPQGLIQAIEGREWQAVIAIVLLALVALAGDVVVRAGVTGRALQVVSLVRGYVGGVCAALLVGGIWWHALLVGCAATGVSAGARDLIVDAVRWLLRRCGKAGAVAALMLASLFAGGCGAENRCLAERTTVAALGVAAGMAEGLIPDTEEARQAMDLASSSIDAGAAIVSACEQLRDDAHDWRGWLSVAVAAVKAVLGIVRAAGVDIPAAVDEQVRRLEELLGDTPIEREVPYEPAYFDA